MPRSAARAGSWRALGPLLFVAIFVLLASTVAAGAVTAESPHPVSVPSTTEWTRTGIEVQAGDTVVVGATGTVEFRGPTNKVGPEGVPWGADCDKRESRATVTAPWPAPGAPCWSLIGRVGTGKPFAVGRSKQVHAEETGVLELGINDNYIADNAGAWKATVFVLPAASASNASSGHSSKTLLYVILALVAIAVIVGLVLLARRSRRARGQHEEKLPKAAAVAVAAPAATAAVATPVAPLAPTDDEHTEFPDEHDASKVNIFEVTLTTSMLRVGYSHFPAGVKVDWSIRRGMGAQSVGTFVTNGGGETRHFVSFPVAVAIDDTQATLVDFRWTIDGVPFTYSVRREPTELAPEPALDTLGE